jgi:hypothetical protein
MAELEKGSAAGVVILGIFLLTSIYTYMVKSAIRCEWGVWGEEKKAFWFAASSLAWPVRSGRIGNLIYWSYISFSSIPDIRTSFLILHIYIRV